MTQLFMVVPMPSISGVYRIDLDMRSNPTYVGHLRWIIHQEVF